MKGNKITGAGLGAFLAVIISVLALVVSIYETSILKSQQAASVWPYLEVNSNYNQDGYSIYASNKGIGPSIIKSVEIRIKNKKIKNYTQLFDTAFPNRVIGYDQIKTSRFNGTVYQSGETQQLIFIPWTEEGKILVSNLKDIQITTTYCSVMNDCWIYEWPKEDRSEGYYLSNTAFEN